MSTTGQESKQLARIFKGLGRSPAWPFQRKCRCMRRVVVTGLGMVTPLGSGVDVTWKKILEGQSGANKVTNFKVDDLACQIACQIPRDASVEGAFNPDDWMDVKEQRKVDDFIVYAMAAADQAMADSGFKAETYEQQARSGVLIGSGIGGLQGIEQGAHLLAEKRPAPDFSVFHSRPPDQSGRGLCLHPPQSERAEPRRGDRLFDRRACHWRCVAPDCLRRCGCDGRRRHRVARLPARAGWLRGLPCPVDRIQ